jgi:hypothetical protein
MARTSVYLPEYQAAWLAEHLPAEATVSGLLQSAVKALMAAERGCDHAGTERLCAVCYRVLHDAHPRNTPGTPPEHPTRADSQVEIG